MLSSMTGSLRSIKIDWFVIALVSTVVAATVLPCRGIAATVCHTVGMAAIAALFFLQGARLSRDVVLGGITNWRLHATIATTTFILFPAMGVMLSRLFPMLLPATLWVGVLFLCTLPSTVQSSIALVSIAQGNVAGAVCSATASNLVGIVLTPVLFAAIAHLQGSQIAVGNVGNVMMQLLVPFITGHLLRPWIGQWAERNRRILALTDRGSILIVVYTAFSAAVVHGVWNQLPPSIMTSMIVVCAVLLAIGLVVTAFVPSVGDFTRPDRIALVFCGSQKSLVTGVPLANVLFPAAMVGPILVPIMIYHPMQLVVCAWLAKRYAKMSQEDAEVATVKPAGNLAGA